MGSENRLLVEGEEDKRVLPELLEKAGLQWGAKGNEVVRIHSLDGVENLTEEQVGSQLKGAGLKRLGVLIDADDDPDARWLSVRASVAPWFALPSKPLSDGFVLPASGSNPRFGVWMMPDNTTRGMLETFMLALRPASEPALLTHAERATDDARNLQAPFSPSHRDKALIHTWLSWRDPPGRQLHQAIQERMLDPAGPYTAPFVKWFKSLFEL
jgi:hypothetical protein